MHCTVTQVAAWQLPQTGTGLLWMEPTEGAQGLVLAAASEQGNMTHLHIYELQLVRFPWLFFVTLPCCA